MIKSIISNYIGRIQFKRLTIPRIPIEFSTTSRLALTLVDFNARKSTPVSMAFHTDTAAPESQGRGLAMLAIASTFHNAIREKSSDNTTRGEAHSSDEHSADTVNLWMIERRLHNRHCRVPARMWMRSKNGTVR